MINSFAVMKKIFVVVVLLSLQSTFVNAADICSDQEVKNLSSEKSGLTFDKFDWNLLNKATLFIGDNHTFTDPEDMFSIIKLLPQVSNKKSCIFLEFPSSIDINLFREKINIEPTLLAVIWRIKA